MLAQLYWYSRKKGRNEPDCFLMTKFQRRTVMAEMSMLPRMQPSQNSGFLLSSLTKVSESFPLNKRIAVKAIAMPTFMIDLFFFSVLTMGRKL